ncbi:MAG: hypothetical protein PF541_06775, partial [Prolixibacteraceae bacterium]|nr:hypothetical protein [Prolixibacteraceae bacterium]
MKKYFSYLYIALFTVIALSSCTDDNTDEYDDYIENLEAYQQKVYEQYKIDSTLIVNYITENDTAAVYNEEYGFFYTIVEEGSDDHPDINSYIVFKYKGTLLDVTVFDETIEDETAKSM